MIQSDSHRPIASRLILACGLVLLSTACTHVEPWQRGTLARADMMWDPDPLLAGLRQHSYFSKEASTGGGQSSAGGCGCN